MCLSYEWFFKEFQLHLVSTRYSHQNNVWIRLVCALRSTWDVKVSIYTDIFHILDSGTNFCYQSIFSSIPLVILQFGKMHWFWPYFASNYRPLYEDFFDDLGIDWLLFFQEKTAKIKSSESETLRVQILNHIGGAQRRFLSNFCLSHVASSSKEICMKNASKLIFLYIFENLRKNCLFAKKGMPKSPT